MSPLRSQTHRPPPGQDFPLRNTIDASPRSDSSVSISSHSNEQTANTSSSGSFCPNCSQEEVGQDNICRNCNLAPGGSGTGSSEGENCPLVKPLEIQQKQRLRKCDAQRQETLPQEQSKGLQALRKEQVLQRPSGLGQPRMQISQLPTSVNTAGSVIGTSSNPINLSDSSPLAGQAQLKVNVPSLSTPTPLVNNGRPASYQSPAHSQLALGYNLPLLNRNVRPYNDRVPPPSVQDINELLSNIQPDEAIKVEDKYAIVPGLAPRMRLMKHQQVHSSKLLF
jgi:hypothetical protein